MVQVYSVGGQLVMMGGVPATVRAPQTLPLPPPTAVIESITAWTVPDAELSVVVDVQSVHSGGTGILLQLGVRGAGRPITQRVFANTTGDKTIPISASLILPGENVSLWSTTLGSGDQSHARETLFAYSAGVAGNLFPLNFPIQF